VHVQPEAEDSQHGEVVALLGLFVDALDALPDAPFQRAFLVAAEINSNNKARAGSSSAAYKIQQQLTEFQTWRRIG
jgi:hypothetical protein